MTKTRELVAVRAVEQAILVIRGQKVILDSDLARLYGVTTSRLNEQVRRNAGRFPADFTFRLTSAEAKSLISQFAISNNLRGGRRLIPQAFTEHGAIMAATVLNSPQAIAASIYVVRAFVKLREMLATHRELAAKFAELEHKLDHHDEQIIALFDAIRELMEPPPEPKRKPIGFQSEMEA